MKDNENKKDNSIFINAILKSSICIVIIAGCMSALHLGLETKANMEDVAYINNKIEYTLEVKELDENNNLVNVFISNKGYRLVDIYDSKLVVYKYYDTSSNISRQSKLFELYPSTDSYWSTISLDGYESINVQFEIPKEINDKDYYIDFDLTPSLYSSDFVNIECFFNQYTT